MDPFDERLLEAGREVFRRHGYQGATAERIAEAAGGSRVTLYRRGGRRPPARGAPPGGGRGGGGGSPRAPLGGGGGGGGGGRNRRPGGPPRRYRDAMWKALTADGNGRERLELALETLCESTEENLEV